MHDGDELDVLTESDWMHDGVGLNARWSQTECTTKSDWMHDGDFF